MEKVLLIRQEGQETQSNWPMRFVLPQGSLNRTKFYDINELIKIYKDLKVFKCVAKLKGK